MSHILNTALKAAGLRTRVDIEEMKADLTTAVGVLSNIEQSLGIAPTPRPDAQAEWNAKLAQREAAKNYKTMAPAPNEPEGVQVAV